MTDRFDVCLPLILAHEGGDLADVMRDALAYQSSGAFVDAPDPQNARSYPCSESNCDRAAYAKGLCNGHYLRMKRGADMKAPFRSMPRHMCSECGGKIGGKGGWGLCANHFKAKRARVIKAALVHAMGGCCQRCSGVYPLSVYDFHHVGNKTADPSYLIGNASLDKIAGEMSACELLCANCHRIEHDDAI